MFGVYLTVGLLAAVTARPQNQHDEARQLSYASPYGLDLQYDFSLVDPQLQYPGYAPQPRLQPQVFLYPGGAPGQPFLLQPAGHPGNFLVPQPPPGFVLRDAPQGNPLFVQGQPKQPYVPPINKDAEEIPTGPSLTATEGRKPEKLENFDDTPEISSGEAEVLAAADRTQLKPGQRFFILNGQPLFSNYPLPQFSNNPLNPGPERIAQDFYYKQPSSYNPNAFFRPAAGDFQQKEEPKRIQPPAFDIRFNDVDFSQSFPSFAQKLEPQFETRYAGKAPSQFKLRPIEVPDEEGSSEEFGYGRDIPKFESKKDALKIVEKSKKEAAKEDSVSQAEPGAIALAGPGGVASASPKGTALSGQKGLAISSPKATAIAGAQKEKEPKQPAKPKKEKQ